MKRILFLVSLLLLSPALLYALDAMGKISKNMYRIPYANGVSVDVTNDYIKHGSSPSGILGPLDMHATTAGQTIVAAADGRVVRVVDTIDGCGCDPAFLGCANFISIDHANNEQTQYVHIAQGSALVNVGDCVVAGQAIATEGDIGFTCGSTREATPGICVPVLPGGAGDCGRHLHLNVISKNGDWEYINPMTCGTSGLLYDSLTNYTANPCNTGACATPTYSFNFTTWGGLLNMSVYQAVDSIWIQNATVRDTAAVVFRAGKKVHLKPGFYARSSSYFRAEIEGCNSTASSGCPPPAPPAELKDIELLAD